MTEGIKIGLRYCGGCNPRYDRVAAVNRLKKMLPGMEFENVQPGVRYDAVLVVSGCSTQCTKTDDLTVPSGRLFRINGYGDLMPLKGVLLELPPEKEAVSLTRAQIEDILAPCARPVLIGEITGLVPGEEITAVYDPGMAGEAFAGGTGEAAPYRDLLLIESMAQTCGIMMLSYSGNEGKRSRLTKIGSARFINTAAFISGVTVYASLIPQESDQNTAVCRCQVLSGGELISDAQLTVSIE